MYTKTKRLISDTLFLCCRETNHCWNLGSHVLWKWNGGSLYHFAGCMYIMANGIFLCKMESFVSGRKILMKKKTTRSDQLTVCCLWERQTMSLVLLKYMASALTIGDPLIKDIQTNNWCCSCRFSAIVPVMWSVFSSEDSHAYSHHEILLNDYPLVLEWLDFDPGHPDEKGTV